MITGRKRDQGRASCPYAPASIFPGQWSYFRLRLCDDGGSLDDNTVALLSKRAYDVAGCASSFKGKSLKVFLNGQRVAVNSFTDVSRNSYSYISCLLLWSHNLIIINLDSKLIRLCLNSLLVLQYLKLYRGLDAPVACDRVNERWEVAVGVSDGQFQQVSQ